ncbi:MAG TPA: hypothetical protein VFQ99_03895, partial [Gallionella sp.]|nr:hypothetical protein [Gallionella sp.]
MLSLRFHSHWLQSVVFWRDSQADSRQPTPIIAISKIHGGNHSMAPSFIYNRILREKSLCASVITNSKTISS